MKPVHSLLLIATLALAANVSAQILTGYGVTKNYGVDQSSNSAPVAGANPYWISAYVFSNTALSGTYSFTAPGGSAHVLTNNGTSADFMSGNYPDSTALNAAFNDGVISMALPNSNGIPQSANLPSLSGDAYPNLPTVTGTWSGGMLQVDPTVNYTLTFAAFSGFNGNSSISMNVQDSGMTTVSSGFSNTSVTTFLITAGALTAGQIYDVSLRFNNNFIDYGVAIAGANGNASYTTENYFQIQAIPEPSTYAAILGSLALAGGMIRRRRNKV